MTQMEHRNLRRRNASVRGEGSRPAWCELLLHRRDCFFALGCGDPILSLAILSRRYDVNVASPFIVHVRKYAHLGDAGKAASCQSKTPRRGIAWGSLPLAKATRAYWCRGIGDTPEQR
jgi:hypothetical protein